MVASAQSASALPATSWRGALLIVVATVAAYWTSFGGVFVFDDVQSIVENPTIRSLAGALLPPPGGLTVSGRPILNLSFALNHAVSGLNPWSYHAVNLAIHAATALVLFGLVRRTLALPALKAEARLDTGDGGRGARARHPQDPAPIALAVALLWVVHPLQTQAVTYAVQRAESLMGLFYLVTVYAFLRGATAVQSAGQPMVGRHHAPARGMPWFVLAVVACLIGMGTKEVMATAPLMVFLFDRTFLAGSYAEAWRRRWRVHLALMATWLPLGWLILDNAGGNRGGTAGFGSTEWGGYVLTQFEAVAHYLRLAVWPHPLVLDYGPLRAALPGVLFLRALAVAALIGSTLWSVWRRPAAGFLGAWFLGILATTSLVPGVHQTIAEHRMYLSLAAVMVALVLVLRAVSGRGAWWIVAGLTIGGAALTAQRNRDYHSVTAIWTDTVAKRPANTNARNNLGNALAEAGRWDAAVAEYQAAIALAPGHADTRYNLALALTALGRAEEALPHLDEALKLRPDYAPASAALGDALSDLGRFAEAVLHYESALRLNPKDADAHHNFGAALLRLDRIEDARRHLAEAVRLRPESVEFRDHLKVVGP